MQWTGGAATNVPRCPTERPRLEARRRAGLARPHSLIARGLWGPIGVGAANFGAFDLVGAGSGLLGPPQIEPAADLFPAAAGR